MTRDERQDLFITKFIDAGGRGTLEAATAFGKTRVALKIIQQLRRIKSDRQVIIVVPHEYLKLQWEGLLKEWKLEANSSVHIVNSFVKSRHECSLMILDEIHRYAAETFSKVFEVVSYRFILGLTAMIKRLDKRHGLITTHCPVIDRVTLEEARLGGYVAPYQEFNLGLDLPTVIAYDYLKLQETYEWAMGIFQWDFGMMRHCLTSYKPFKAEKSGIMGSACERLARKYGWKGNSPLEAWTKMVAKEKDFWGGNLTHPYHPNRIYIAAVNGMKSMKKMKDIIYKAEVKLDAAAAILALLPKMKSITFAELTETADEMTKRVPGSAAYHSSMTVTTPEGEKLTKKKGRAYIIDRINSGDIRCIHTAKALDEGADFPEISLGIRISGSSSPTQQIQRRGRIIRKFEGKEAVMINIYVKNTKEAQWLSKSQGFSDDIVWVDTIEEIIENIAV
jgi:superfamily II DNA or RNA helicase